jgi:hypothetical protein
MEVIITVLAIVSALQLAYIIKLRKQFKEKPPSKELSEFLGDLSRGSGLVAIRINPDNLLIRSPRN